MKEDLGFSKEGFETLGSSLEKKEDTENRDEKRETEDSRTDGGTSAWYEKDSGPAWYETESFSEEIFRKAAAESVHKPHPMLEEHERHEHTFPDKRREERNFSSSSPDLSKTSAWPNVQTARTAAAGTCSALPAPAFAPAGRYGEAADGKIYLPNPPPKFFSDNILNQSGYIEQNFKTNESIKKGKKKANPICFGLGMVMGFLFLMSLGIWNSSVSVVFFCIAAFLIAVGVGKNEYVPEKFFLIKPYALKVEELEGSNSGACIRLRIFFIGNGGGREATTERVYTAEQAGRLAEAFRKGELVVACRPKAGSSVNDVAVICSPSVR